MCCSRRKPGWVSTEAGPRRITPNEARLPRCTIPRWERGNVRRDARDHPPRSPRPVGCRPFASVSRNLAPSAPHVELVNRWNECLFCFQLTSKQPCDRLRDCHYVLWFLQKSIHSLLPCFLLNITSGEHDERDVLSMCEASKVVD